MFCKSHLQKVAEINFVGAVTRGKPFSGGKRVIPRTPFLKPLNFCEVCFQKQMNRNACDHQILKIDFPVKRLREVSHKGTPPSKSGRVASE